MSVADRVPAADLTLPVVALGVGVLLWWVASAALALPQYLLPSPGSVGARLVDSPELYAVNAWITLRRVLVGGAAGVASGAVLAVLVAHAPLLRRTLVPYLVAARVLPKIAVAPVLLIYLGTGSATGIAFVALVAFFPMVVSTVAGLESVPVGQLDLFASVDAGPFATFVHLRLPHALPDAFAGVKQSTTLSVVGAIVAEWVVSTDGLGALILVALENVRTDITLAALIVLILEGLALYGVVVAVERRVLWDHRDRDRRSIQPGTR
ncbi:ABC transporter permease [Halomarina halobia]|uniref:ABC transporter permease n=1 Tax=Halomarina halobia TaxID=3033386 RepID=A0ABD6A915_9EURY|nr:ABC transporter permease [Halomarina sp. PSR21]